MSAFKNILTNWYDETGEIAPLQDIIPVALLQIFMNGLPDQSKPNHNRTCLDIIARIAFIGGDLIHQLLQLGLSEALFNIL